MSEENIKNTSQTYKFCIISESSDGTAIKLSNTDSEYFPNREMGISEANITIMGPGHVVIEGYLNEGFFVNGPIEEQTYLKLIPEDRAYFKKFDISKRRFCNFFKKEIVGHIYHPIFKHKVKYCNFMVTDTDVKKKYVFFNVTKIKYT